MRSNVCSLNPQEITNCCAWRCSVKLLATRPVCKGQENTAFITQTAQWAWMQTLFNWLFLSHAALMSIPHSCHKLLKCTFRNVTLITSLTIMHQYHQSSEPGTSASSYQLQPQGCRRRKADFCKVIQATQSRLPFQGLLVTDAEGMLLLFVLYEAVHGTDAVSSQEFSLTLSVLFNLVGVQMQGITLTCS